MSHVRIYGDPFGEDAAASHLRSFLRLALGSGLRCSLALGAVRSRAPAPGEARIPLTDGVADLEVGTLLPPAEIDLLMRAAATGVASSAPLVVFDGEERLADRLTLAGLEWPAACVVLAASPEQSAVDLLGRVRAELRWAGNDRPNGSLSERQLAPWLAVPQDGARSTIVHPAAVDGSCGTDLVLRSWRSILARPERRLRLVLAAASESEIERLVQSVRFTPGTVEVVRGPLEPEHCRDAGAILVPARVAPPAGRLVECLASGRPVCVAASTPLRELVDGPGVAHRIGGRQVGDRFEPDPAALVAAVEEALTPAGAAVGGRGRRHVEETLVRGRPAPASPVPGPLGDPRPTVVLEAPFFETSSSAELSIETARALQRRGNVDLRLVPVGPPEGGLAALRALRERAPELEARLTRQPGRVDLWLSSGWPARAVRPDCRTWALRVDWEYGALPVDLTPHVTQDADLVVVHSEHVRDCVVAAGRDARTVELVPHGVDAAMHENAAPAADILRFKGTRPAVLFCGGLVWRKGFDVFLRSVLAARAGGLDFVVVVKSIGHDRHYGQFHLRDLVDRFHETKGTPPLRLIDAALARHELAGVYRACDLLLHPYRGEGFGLPVLEARAVGLPVLATAGGGADGILAVPGAQTIPATRREVELPAPHVGTPWVLEPDPEAAARLLIATLRDLPGHASAAVANAAAVRERFSWLRAAARIERLAGCAQRGGEPTVALARTEKSPSVPSPTGAFVRPKPLGV